MMATDKTPQPLQNRMAIVNPDGTPTDYFIRWAQERQKAILDTTDAAQVEAIAEDVLAGRKLIGGVGIDVNSGPEASLSADVTIDAKIQELLDLISSTRGSVLYRGNTAWAALAPGTAGQVLSTNGAGADPSWIAAGGGGSGGKYPVNIPAGITVLEDFTQTLSIAAWTLVPAANIAVSAQYDGASFTASNPTSSLCAALLRPITDFGFSSGIANGEAIVIRCENLGETSLYHLIQAVFTTGTAAGAGTQIAGAFCAYHNTAYGRSISSSALYSGFNTRTSLTGDVALNVDGARPVWIRLAKIGGNYRQDISTDGVFWITVNTVASAAAITHAGFMFCRIDGSGGNGKTAVQLCGSMTGVT